MDNPDLRVLARQLGGLFFTADQGREFPVRMSIGKNVKTITANVTGGTSSAYTIRSAMKSFEQL